MKRTKLLIPLLSSLSLAPAIAGIVSCSCDNDKEAKKIANAIFDPTDLTTTKETSDFYDTVKRYSDDDKKKELVYDLFGMFNTKGFRGIDESKSFKDLYKDNTVSIKTNITNCELNSFDDANKTANVKFLGYVSFVFSKDHANFKTNDYVMITYDLSAQKVVIDNDNCSLKYEPVSSDPSACVGMIKEMINGNSRLSYIKSIDTNTLTPKNSQYYIKK